MTDPEVIKMAFELLCDAVEPTATQIQADIWYVRPMGR